MEFGSDNYEEFFDKLRSHTGPRNLQQIFDDDEKPLQFESNTLRYQPQKPHHQQSKHKNETKGKPSAGEKSQAATTTTSSKRDRSTAIIAKVAHGYNGKDKIGRVGVALTLNESESIGQIRLIVYKSRSEILSTLILTPNSKKPNVILRESYLQFYDNENRFWSVRFESSADEQEFTKTMLKHGLPLEQMPTSNAGYATASSNVPAISTATATSNATNSRNKGNDISSTVNLEKLSITPGSRLPHPQPRPRHAQRPALQQTESEEETEDIIVTPVPQAIASTDLIPLNMALATTTSAVKEDNSSSSRASTVDKLDIYMVEQRASGHVMEKKMDSILQAMSRLTVPNNGSGMGMTENFDTLSKSAAINDKEDELLELEQKLLNFKKENRALMKTLKAKEQALNDLRSSTCALCEELLAQNKELKQQNAALLGAMTQMRSQQVSVGTGDSSISSTSSSSTCQQCDHSAAKVLMHERRLSAMQNALNANGSVIGTPPQ